MKYDHEANYNILKKFYTNEIRKAADENGYRKMSAKLGHDENFVSTVLRQNSFVALRNLYLDIFNGGLI